MKVYFASPWFNTTQAEIEERVKNELRRIGFDVWSPKDNAVCEVKAKKEIREEIFRSNCDNIKDCDILFAITDEKDMGTIWEAGFANGLNETRGKDDKIIIIYYCETLEKNGKFNLMLAQSGDIVITEFSELHKLFRMIRFRERKKYVGNIE